VVISLNTVLLVVILSVSATAQDGPAFHSNLDIAVVPFTVLDGNGAVVSGLSRQDFRVYDNDVRRTIQSFAVDHDIPVTLGVLIDASESQADQIAEHRRTAIGLLDRIMRPGDRTFVLSVKEDVRLWVDLSSTATGVRRAMAEAPLEPFGTPCAKRSSAKGLGPVSACGSSPVWNAIYDAAVIKMRGVTGAKALLVLTDGFDSGSTHTWQQAADAANAADTRIYAIQYRSGFGRDFAPDLYRLAAAAGGVCFRAPEGDYGAILSRIESDLRDRYVLGFRPERLSGKIRHDVRVEAVRPELTVRARRTYFEDR
jgi:Ca-activated chloride channel family protein